MNRSKKQSLIFLGGFAIYILLLAFYFENAYKLISIDGLFISTVLYILYNPAYMLLIIGSLDYKKLSERKAWQKILGSIFLVLALDLPSMPRLSFLNGLGTSAESITNMGNVVISKMMNIGLSFKFSWVLYYVALPLLCLFISMKLYGFVKFSKKVKSGE